MDYSGATKFLLGQPAPDMRGWSVQAAMRLACSLSGKTDEDIAAEMGWPPSQRSRILNNQDYWPSLPNIPRFCEVVGNKVIARWVADNAVLVPDAVRPTDAPALFRQLGELISEISDVMREATRAMQNGHIDTRDARRVLGELRDVLGVGSQMLAGLQAVIDKERQA